MRKLLISIFTVAALAAVVVTATSAYFSDTETSVDNTFVAGSIDLQIDNSSWYNGAYSEDTSWSLTDLTIERFFDFDDVKPGDWGQDAISIHVEDNPSWVCANITLTSAAENGVGEPEEDDGDDPLYFGPWDGELDDEISFVFWADDGDNVYESGEGILMSGTGADLPQGDANGGTTYPITDSGFNAFGAVGDAFPAEVTQYIAKAWCFGDLTLAPVEPGSGDPATNPGYTCDGSVVNNVSQSDDMIGDISFYAVQQRHNESFLCSSWNPSGN